MTFSNLRARPVFLLVAPALLAAACIEDDCLEKRTCVRVGEPAAQGGAGAGTGGVTATPAQGGQADPGAMGGADGSSGAPATLEDGGAAGEAAELEGLVAGARCSKETELSCGGPASSVVLECVEGRWALAKTCEEGSLCDSNDPSCAPIVAGCERLAPRGSFCEGLERVICGPDLVTVEREECEERCTAGECVGLACGDGQVEMGEECDDGNVDDTDACTSQCKAAVCGDGIVWKGHEECDDGNADDSDACTSQCKQAVCGDNIVWKGHEECDDGNADGSDECTSECTEAVCGDKILWEGHEECDDGNSSDTDGCLKTCQLAVCGDGFVNSEVEDCDDGANTSGDGCSKDCKAEPLQLVAGGQHTCALLGDGRVKCWGNNEFGQVGTQSDTRVGDKPGEMGAALATTLDGASAIAAGERHTCAIQNGGVVCWGDNADRQLGNSTSARSSRPVQIPVPGVPRQLCASGTTSAALLENGKVATWGNFFENPTGMVLEVAFPSGVVSIACGEFVICARYDDHVTCWGRYADLSFGFRDTPSNSQPLRDLAAGSEHVCALLDNRRMWCFGSSNSEGALARVPVTGFYWPDDRDGLDTRTVPFGVTGLGLGGSSTCAVYQDGSVRCWGKDLAGNLGQPRLTAAAEGADLGDAEGERGDELPTINLGTEEGQPRIVKSVVTSGRHTCALFDTNQIRCWGDNSSGQLGIGSSESLGDDEGEMGNSLPLVEIN